MLQEHLSQNHDLASRRLETISKHVDWIHSQVLSGSLTKILDLGCGPGLYTSQLARLGHECVGIDFSPASIEYAVDIAQKENLNCTYYQRDIRHFDFGTDFGLVMFIFGEFNVFSTADAKNILFKANRALTRQGKLLLEPHTFAALQKIGKKPPTWYTSEEGLFSDKPHLSLSEHFWDPQKRVATTRIYIINCATKEVVRYAESIQAYNEEEYETLLEESGFGGVKFAPSLMGEVDVDQENLLAITATKQREMSRPR
jgi:SAM-dependent methyltransferase